MPTLYHFIIGASLILILWLRFYLKSIPRIQINIITYTLALVLVVELIGFYTARQRINNTLIYNIGWVYLESFLLIAYFYTLEQNLFWRKRILQISGTLGVWGIVNSLFLEPIAGALQYFSLLPFAAFLITLAIRLLHHLLNLEVYTQKSLLSTPHFWISSAILFFYLEAVILFGTYYFYPEIIIKNVNIAFTINKLMAGLMYFAFGIAFILPHFDDLNKKQSDHAFS